MDPRKKPAPYKLPLPWKLKGRPPSLKRILDRVKARIKWLLEKKGIAYGHLQVGHWGHWGLRFAEAPELLKASYRTLPALFLKEKTSKSYMHLSLSVIYAPTEKPPPVRRYWIDKHGRFDEEKMVRDIHEMFAWCKETLAKVKQEGAWRDAAIRARTKPLRALGKLPEGVKVDLQDDLSYLLGVARIVTIDQVEELVAMVRRWEET